MTLGNKIAQLRKAHNITQEALAQKLDVTNQAVSKWESDQCCPDILLLPRLADIFGVSIDALFDREIPHPEPVIPTLPWPDDAILRVAAYIGHKLVSSMQAQTGFQMSIARNVAAVLSTVSVQCGDVGGNVDAGGSVTCGNVGGSVDAGCSVNCGEVTGDVDAGTDVNCGNVGGSVDAGVNIACGDVGGDVDAGCNVQCGSVSGDVDAGLSITVQK